jgi:hypothetical protein
MLPTEAETCVKRHPPAKFVEKELRKIKRRDL